MRRLVFFLLGALAGGVLGLIIPPLTARDLLFLGGAYHWLFWFYFNPFFWVLLGGFLTLRVRSRPALILWTGIFLLVSVAGLYPSAFFVWGTGIPCDVEYKEFAQRSDPVSISGTPFQLIGKYRVAEFTRTDGSGRKGLGSTCRLVSGERVLREWKEPRNTLGLLFPADDGSHLIVVLEGLQQTRIFRVDPATGQAEELRDFRSLLEEKDSVVRRYAGRGLALEVLPRTKILLFRDEWFQGGEETLARFRTALGEKAVPIALQFLGDEWDMKWEELSEEGQGDNDRISERAALVLGALKVTEAVVPILESGVKRDRLRFMPNGFGEAINFLGEDTRPYLQKAALEYPNAEVRSQALFILEGPIKPLFEKRDKESR